MRPKEAVTSSVPSGICPTDGRDGPKAASVAAPERDLTLFEQADNRTRSIGWQGRERHCPTTAAIMRTIENTHQFWTSPP